jgi:hypothetical protein
VWGQKLHMCNFGKDRVTCYRHEARCRCVIHRQPLFEHRLETIARQICLGVYKILPGFDEFSL